MMEFETEAELTTRARGWLVAVGAVGLASTVRVSWNARMRSTAGTAQAGTGQIDLNPRLAGFGAEQVDRTLRHEAAHLLANWRAGKRRIASHGPEWRQACVDLGIAGEKATHTLPLPRRKVVPRYAYQCPNCRMILKRVRLFRRPTACLGCCRKLNGGQFSAGFQFRRVALTLEEQ